MKESCQTDNTALWRIMVTGVIFDMDGVLLDSMPVWENIDIVYLRQHGKEPKPGLKEALLTKSLTEAADYIRVEYGLPKTAEEIAGEIVAAIHGQYKEKIPMKKGALAFLKQLREHGIAVTVATSSDRLLAEAAFRRLGMLPFIGNIFTCEETGAGKRESPAVYLNALAYMGTRIEETWVFEDVLHGIRTAGQAGFKTVGIYDASSEYNLARIQQEASIYLGDLQDFERFYREAVETE